MSSTVYNYEWDNEYVTRVREEKDKFRGDKDKENLLRMVTESAYSAEIHYVLELIQNAEDEDSKTITFTITKDSILVENDGKPFSADDVFSICSAGQSKKENKIGFFGIGFKSVFNISKSPQIISGKYNLVIKDYIYPEPVNFIPDSIAGFDQSRGAFFILPINTHKGLNGSGLAKGLYEINERLMLFLDSLERLVFRDKTNKEERVWEIKKDRLENGFVRISNSGSGQSSTWKVFDKLIKVPHRKEIRVKGKENIVKTRVVIAFPHPEEDTDISAEKVYCFLPTEKRTDLPFLIQGDFIPTLGRENIEDNEWNRWLLKKIGELACETFLKMRENQDYGEHLYDLIPLPEEIQDQVIKIIPDTMVKKLKKEKIAHCQSSWEHVQDAALLDDKLAELISERDLEEVFRRKVRKAWDGLNDRGRKVLSELGVKQFGPLEVLRLLKIRQALKKKKGQWFLDIYDYFAEKKRSLWRREDIWDHLWDIKFLLTSTGELAAPRDRRRPYRLITHYPQKKEIGNLDRIFESGELVFLDKFFQVAKKGTRRQIDPVIEEKRRRVKEFLKEYDVERYMEDFHIINKVVLESFSSGRHHRFSKKKLVIFTNFIRENLSLYASRMRGQRSWISEDEIFDEIRCKLLLKGFYYENGRRKEGFFRPEELHFHKLNGKTTDVFKVFKGVDGIPFLSQIYYDRRLVKGYSTVDPGRRRGRKKEVLAWDDFFIEMGVWSSPRLLSRATEIDPGDTRYKGIPFDDSSEGHNLLGDHYFPDIEKLIKHVNGEIQKTQKAKMGIFIDLVARNWDRAYKKRTISKYRRFYYREYKKDVEFASFLIQMKELDWMPSENIPGLFRPNKTYVGSKENLLLLREDTPFVANKAAYRGFYRAIEVNESPTAEYVMGYLEDLKAKWIRDSFPRDWLEKMKAIYAFLMDAMERDKVGQDSETIIRAFQEKKLVFLPTEKKNWWGVRDVFWRDMSDVFSRMRGYLSGVYPPDIENFFESVGVKKSPDISDCIRVLAYIGELHQKNESEEFRKELKGTIDPVYKEICGQLKTRIPGQDYEKDYDFNKNIFLTARGSFKPPGKLLYSDSEKLRKMFGHRAEIVWLRSDWRNLIPLFEEAGIDSLSSRVNIQVIKGDEWDIPEDQKEPIRSLSGYLGRYIQYAFPEKYLVTGNSGPLDKIKKMDIKLVSSLSLRYQFSGKTGGKKGIVDEPNVEAFYDDSENTIYILESSDWLCNSLDAISEEITKILDPLGVSLKTQIESLLSTGFDEESRAMKFESLGIPQHIIQEFEGPRKQRLRKGKEKGTESVTPEPEEEEVSGDLSGEEGEKEITAKIEPTDSFKLKSEELVSLDDISRFTIERKGEPSVDVGIVAKHGKGRKRRKGAELEATGDIKISIFRKSTVSRHETESKAIEIVRLYEKERKRNPKDVRNDGVGYDVESSERKIEVKSFKGGPGTVELYETEYKAAKKYKENFYIYVVYNLLKGSQPKIEIIRDPINSVVFEAEKRTATNWKDCVKEKIEFLSETKDE